MSKHSPETIERHRRYKYDLYHNNPEYKQAQIAAARFRITGWSAEDYQTAFDRQHGCCALCGVHQSQLTIALSADHDHEFGVKRELLCRRCNRGLGDFLDNPEVLRKAADYVEKYRESDNGKHESK